MDGNIARGLNVIVIGGIVFFLLFIALGTYSLIDIFTPTLIKSNRPIVPEIRLHTDGKIIDTIYIYKLKA